MAHLGALLKLVKLCLGPRRTGSEGSDFSERGWAIYSGRGGSWLPRPNTRRCFFSPVGACRSTSDGRDSVYPNIEYIHTCSGYPSSAFPRATKSKAGHLGVSPFLRLQPRHQHSCPIAGSHIETPHLVAVPPSFAKPKGLAQSNCWKPLAAALSGVRSAKNCRGCFAVLRASFFLDAFTGSHTEAEDQRKAGQRTKGKQSKSKEQKAGEGELGNPQGNRSPGQLPPRGLLPEACPPCSERSSSL